MNPVIFKADSWHYWLSQFGGYCPDDTDICRYTKAVLRGLWWVAVLVSLALAGCYLLGQWLGWLLAGIVYSFVAPEHGAFILCALVGSVAALAAVGFVAWLSTEKVAPTMRHSFAAEAYRSFKDRVCFRVRVE